MPRRVATAVVLLLGTCVAACDDDRIEAPATSDLGGSEGNATLLEGTFRAAGRSGSGRARIVRKGASYQLHLDSVATNGAPPVHVYLVGLTDASTTRAVQETDTKYDFGLLHASGTQVIDLPGEPAAEIKSVVLYNPRFGVNLAWAPLSPP